MDIKTCARLGCNETFAPKTVRHIYCSNICGNRVRVARHAHTEKRENKENGS
jgi:predicted RNA-binding Zn ribbon-like protein